MKSNCKLFRIQFTFLIIVIFLMNACSGTFATKKPSESKNVEIDVVDEAIIDADPATVFKALLDEANGSTNWWVPHWKAELRENASYGQVGSIIDITVRRPGKKIRLTSKTTEIIENQLIRVKFIEGDLVGDGEWTFEPVNDKTKIRFRYRARTNNLLFKLISRLIDIGKAHSEVMQAGFEGLNKYLKHEKANK